MVKNANRRGRQKESCTAAALLALLCADGAAAAQTAPPAGPVAAAAPGMGDIVITARRREERLQQVPIAVSAVSGRSLAGAGVAQSRDLTLVMPSLVFSKANASFQPYIRGVGTRNTNVGDESSVSVYVDGIYQPVNGNSQGLRPPVPPVVATQPWTVALSGEPVGISSQKFVWMKLATFIPATVRNNAQVVSRTFSIQNIEATGHPDLPLEIWGIF